MAVRRLGRRDIRHGNRKHGATKAGAVATSTTGRRLGLRATKKKKLKHGLTDSPGVDFLCKGALGRAASSDAQRRRTHQQRRCGSGRPSARSNQEELVKLGPARINQEELVKLDPAEGSVSGVKLGVWRNPTGTLTQGPARHQRQDGPGGASAGSKLS
jgi:hypothetical protein